jgi:hypothetical protein
MQRISDEFSQIVARAIHHNLLPADVTELEFFVDAGSYQATALEYWPSSARHDSNRVVVQIPNKLLHKFKFIRPSMLYRRQRSNGQQKNCKEFSCVVNQESWAPEPMFFRNHSLRNELYIFSLNACIGTVPQSREYVTFRDRTPRGM